MSGLATASGRSGVALDGGVRMAARSPVDVGGAASFATAVFLGGLERLGRNVSG